jgi:hypothetical protein
MVAIENQNLSKHFHPDKFEEYAVRMSIHIRLYTQQVCRKGLQFLNL